MSQIANDGVVRVSGGDSEEGVLPGAASLVELRRYVLLPGRRGDLIRAFDDFLAEAQRLHGIHVCAQLLSVEDPDSFVWMRSFESIEQRRNALSSFYRSKDWLAVRSSVLAMISEEQEDVLLLEPIGKVPSWLRMSPTPHVRAATSRRACYSAWLFEFDAQPVIDFERFHVAVQLCTTEVVGTSVGAFVHSRKVNTFPSLPCRQEQQGYACLVKHASVSDAANALQRLRGLACWRAGVEKPFRQWFSREPEFLRLVPTRGSHLQ